MAYFRLYVLDAKNRQIASINVNADHKLAAIENARGLLTADSSWFAFELWQNARQVHKELRSDFDLLRTPLVPIARSVTYLKTAKRAQGD
jgi:hypothetical protein